MRGLVRTVVAVALSLTACSQNEPKMPAPDPAAMIPAVASGGSGVATPPASSGSAGAIAVAAGSGGSGTAGGGGGTPGSGAAGAMQPRDAGALQTADAGGTMATDAGGQSDPDGCTRELLKTTVDLYFKALAARDPAMLPLAETVKFTENGETLELGEGWASAGAVIAVRMTARVILADVEAGLAAGFTMFQGRYTDVHMIKYTANQVRGVHTILGSADGSGWD